MGQQSGFGVPYPSMKRDCFKKTKPPLSCSSQKVCLNHRVCLIGYKEKKGQSPKGKNKLKKPICWSPYTDPSPPEGMFWSPTRKTTKRLIGKDPGPFDACFGGNEAAWRDPDIWTRE